MGEKQQCKWVRLIQAARCLPPLLKHLSEIESHFSSLAASPAAYLPRHVENYSNSHGVGADVHKLSHLT